MDTQQLEQLKFSLMLHTPLAPSHAPLNPGDHCLAHFTDQGLWYRVRVESLVDEEELCVVKYLDYGNIATVSKLDTAPLPEECVRLPAQAIPCRLSNVLGRANGWGHLVGQDGEWDAAKVTASSPVHLFSSFVMDQVVTVTVEVCLLNLQGFAQYMIIDCWREEVGRMIIDCWREEVGRMIIDCWGWMLAMFVNCNVRMYTSICLCRTAICHIWKCL